jgi:hypothetical protein
MGENDFVGPWDEEPPPYATRLLCYLDILGWEALTRKPDQDTLKRIHRGTGLIEATADIHSWRKQQRHLSDSQLGRSLSRSNFSDTIVFSCSPEPSDVRLMIEDIRRFWMHLIQLGHYVRGAIALGDARHDESAVYGPALVEAYRLESSVASYPRIVVSDDAGPVLDRIQLVSKEASPIFKDYDGLTCFDLFPTRPDGTRDPAIGAYATMVREQVVADLKKTRDRTTDADCIAALNHRAKYGWMLQYIDRVLLEVVPPSAEETQIGSDPTTT